MTRTAIKINILRLIFLSIFFLAGCSKPNPPATTLSLPTSTSSYPTDTPSAPTAIPNTLIPDTLTPSPLPTLTTTPTPSPTPLATLNPQDAQQEIARLMETNNNCSGVCFWGITPGVSNFDQEVRFLKTLKDEGQERTKNGTKSFLESFEYKDGILAVSIEISEVNETVQEVTATSGGFLTLKLPERIGLHSGRIIF